MDDLSIALNSSRIKDAYEMILNHLCYVDDLCLIIILLQNSAIVKHNIITMRISLTTV